MQQGKKNYEGMMYTHTKRSLLNPEIKSVRGADEKRTHLVL